MDYEWSITRLSLDKLHFEVLQEALIRLLNTLGRSISLYENIDKKYDNKILFRLHPNIPINFRKRHHSEVFKYKLSWTEAQLSDIYNCSLHSPPLLSAHIAQVSNILSMHPFESLLKSWVKYQWGRWHPNRSDKEPISDSLLYKEVLLSLGRWRPYDKHPLLNSTSCTQQKKRFWVWSCRNKICKPSGCNHGLQFTLMKYYKHYDFHPQISEESGNRSNGLELCENEI